MEFKHVPVLLKECIDALNIRLGGVYVDCTLGGGGHSSEILKRRSAGKLYSFDKDIEAIQHCKGRFSKTDNIFLINDDFKNAASELKRRGITEIDGVLMDLGISSYQIDNSQRGFSYHGNDVRLDMRMDSSQELDAYTVVNTYTQAKLAEIIAKYGEDKFACNIAKNIVVSRNIKPIETTRQLADIVDKSIPFAAKRTGGHPAKKTFQAIRIEVNGELSGLDKAIEDLTSMLTVGGRIAVISFHSLEDRIIKQTFAKLSEGCICPKTLPTCVCNNKPKIKLINKHTVPSEEELLVNTRAASAKLRVAEKL